jgi:hypothetical protein
MNNTSVHSESRRIDLAEGAAVSVQCDVGDVVRCMRGKIWLTQEHDSRDYCLVPGVSFCADRQGRIVLDAIGAPGAVVVERRSGAHALARGRLSIDSLHTIVRAAQRARREWIAQCPLHRSC